MPETFGEADVILRARLDLLQKDLDAGEQMVATSSARVAQAQVQAAQQVAGAQQDSGTTMGDIAVAGLHAIGIWRTLGSVIQHLGLALRALPALIASVGVAMSALAVGGVTAAALGAGLLADKMLRVRDSAALMVDAFRGLDGSKQKALEFADALGRIPIAGGAARQLFLMFSRDAGKTTEAWTKLVAKMEDGQVKVGLLGRAINGLINLSGPGIVARLLGFDTDLVGEIDKANKELERMNQILAVQKQNQPVGEQVGRSARGFAQSAERDSALVGTEGVDRVRLEEQYRFQDAMQHFDDLERASHAFHAAQVQQIKDQVKEQGLGARRQRELLDAAAQAAHQRSANIQMARQAAEKALTDAAQKRLDLAKQEEAEQQKLRALEERRAEAEQANQRTDLVSGAAAARAQTAGNDVEAQRIELEAARQRALRDLVVQGHEELLDATNDFYDARAALIDAREREALRQHEELAAKRAQAEAEAWRAEQERMEQQQLATLQTNEQLRSQILQARLRQAGDEVAAQQEAIRQRFQEMIDQLERDGNSVGADLAAKLRDLELAATENQDATQRTSRHAEFEQVSLSRINLNGPVGGETDRVQRDQLSALKNIDRNTKPSNRTAAIAG